MRTHEYTMITMYKSLTIAFCKLFFNGFAGFSALQPQQDLLFALYAVFMTNSTNIITAIIDTDISFAHSADESKLTIPMTVLFAN